MSTDKKRSAGRLFIRSAAWTLLAFLLTAVGYFGAKMIADML